MDTLFLTLLDRSLDAGWVVLAVAGLRFLLKKAPKGLHCCLWALVALRLVSPFSLESALSLMPKHPDLSVAAEETLPEQIRSLQWEEDSQPGDRMTVTYQTPQGQDQTYEVYLDRDGTTQQVTAPRNAPSWLSIAGWVWLAGMILMLSYAAFSYRRLHRRVAASIDLGSGVRLCDYIDTPFILGFLSPKIYLPSDMDPRDAAHVLAHERAHLKRRDHWWKPLGFGLLAVYWFHPLLWLGYLLLCRDIELACDERVVGNMDPAEKKEYSRALLNCSVTRPMVMACPLAFGEVGVKQRVKNVLQYRKPGFWILAAAAAVSLAAAVCLLTDPAASEGAADQGEPSLETLQAEETAAVLSKGFPAVTGEDITAVSFWDRRGSTDISAPADLRYVLSVLSKAGFQTQALSDEPIDRNVDDQGFPLPTLIFYWGQQSFTVMFEQDFSCYWGIDGESATVPYPVADPRRIQDLFLEMVDPVRDEETAGMPFATVDTPWEWMQQATMNCAESARFHFSQGSTNHSGTLSAYHLKKLLSVLKEIPEGALHKGEFYEKTSSTDLYYSGSGITIAIADRVNGLIVILRTVSGQSQIILHGDLDQMWNGGYKPQDVQVWNIQDNALSACLSELTAHSPLVYTFVGGQYQWDTQITEVSGAGAAISMRLLADWQREIVTYTEGAASFGVRCRPAEESEGWIYFSFWPDGYHPQEVNRYYNEHYRRDHFGYASYPIAVSWNGFLGDVTPWSHQRFPTDLGDYAIINQGADGWLLKYAREIDAMDTLCEFLGGISTIQTVPESPMAPIAYTQSSDPQKAPHHLKFDLEDPITLVLDQGWMYTEDDTPAEDHRVLFRFWPEYETRGAVTAAYYPGGFQPPEDMEVEQIRLYRPDNSYYEAFQGTQPGAETWSWLWIHCKAGSFVFRFQDTEHWHQEFISAACSQIGEITFQTYG